MCKDRVGKKRKKMINLLTNLYQQGIELFSASKTLDDFTRFSTATNTQWTLNYRIIRDVLDISNSSPFPFPEISSSTPTLLNRLLYNCKSDVSNIFLHYLSTENQYFFYTIYTHSGQMEQRKKVLEVQI